MGLLDRTIVLHAKKICGTTRLEYKFERVWTLFKHVDRISLPLLFKTSLLVHGGDLSCHLLIKEWLIQSTFYTNNEDYPLKN